MKVHGRYVLSSAEFLKAVLGSTDAQQFEGTVTKNGVRTRFVRGGATQMVFQIPRTPSNASAWERLKDDESKWDIDYCYCSVFDECWRVSSVWNEPQSVKQCTRDPSHEFMP